MATLLQEGCEIVFILGGHVSNTISLTEEEGEMDNEEHFNGLNLLHQHGCNL